MSKLTKKGQAAIEFLMTYGWMLLIVLIVGALIFSFMDFGSILQNKLSLNNDLKVDGNKMSASGTSQKVSIVFKYYGVSPIAINATASTLKTELGDLCGESATNVNAVTIKNLGNTGLAPAVSGSAIPTIKFTNEQLGLIEYTCPAATLQEGTTLNGKVSIGYSDILSGLVRASSGELRLYVDQ